MSEPLKPPGKTAEILAVAGSGFKLAITLFSFAEAMGSTDHEIIRAARDITIFSQVLKLLGSTIDRGVISGYVSPHALQTTQGIVNECKEVFRALDEMIVKSTNTEEVVKMKGDVAVTGEKLIVPFRKRLLFVFQKNKVEVLRRSLESLKTSLQVMLSVLSYAEHIETAKKSIPSEKMNEEELQAFYGQDRFEMESLVMANEAAAAEVRKDGKSKGKIKRKEKKSFSTEVKAIDERPSIAEAGILRELTAKPPPDETRRPEPVHAGHPPPFTNNVLASSYGPPSTYGYSGSASDNYLSSLSWHVPTLEPPATTSKDRSEEQAPIPVRESGQVVNQLLSLWVSNVIEPVEHDTFSGGHYPPPPPAEGTYGSYKPYRPAEDAEESKFSGEPSYRRTPWNETHTKPSQPPYPSSDDGENTNFADGSYHESYSYGSWPPHATAEASGEARTKEHQAENEMEGEEEFIDLFPKRVPQPYSMNRESSATKEESDEDEVPIDLFPKREARPYATGPRAG